MFTVLHMFFYDFKIFFKFRGLFEHELGISQDYAQWIVDLMCHTGGQFSQGSQFVCLGNLLLHLFFVIDVLDDKMKGFLTTKCTVIHSACYQHPYL